MKKLYRALRKYRRKERRNRIHHHPTKYHFFKHLVAKTVNQLHRAMAAHQEGVDFFGTGPSVSSLVAADKKFVGRYLGFVTREEIDAYHKAGLTVVLFFERGNEDAAEGRAMGQKHGAEAMAELRRLGAPVGVVVYFACDWEVHPDQMDGIRAYFKAAKEELHEEHTGHKYAAGLYGGLGVVEWAANNKLVEYFCQTYAWSHHVWDARAQLRQVLIDLPSARVIIGGAAVDLDKSTRLDFGQWGAHH